MREHYLQLRARPDATATSDQVVGEPPTRLRYPAGLDVVRAFDQISRSFLCGHGAAPRPGGQGVVRWPVQVTVERQTVWSGGCD
jgi:hypothetical protein